MRNANVKCIDGIGLIGRFWCASPCFGSFLFVIMISCLFPCRLPFSPFPPCTSSSDYDFIALMKSLKVFLKSFAC